VQNKKCHNYGENSLQTQNKEGMWEQPTQDWFLFYKKHPQLPLNVTGHGWFTAPLNLSSISY